MFMQQTDRLAVNPVREAEARSIGSIINNLQEIAALRTRMGNGQHRQHFRRADALRSRALRRNSA